MVVLLVIGGWYSRRNDEAGMDLPD